MVVVVDDAVLVLSGREVKETLNAEHFVLLKHFEELSHNVREHLLCLDKQCLNLPVASSHSHLLLVESHQGIIGSPLVEDILEHNQVLQLVEYPGRFHLVHDPFEHGCHSLQQERVFLVVFLSDDLQVLRNDSIVDED